MTEGPTSPCPDCAQLREEHRRRKRRARLRTWARLVLLGLAAAGCVAFGALVARVAG